MTIERPPHTRAHRPAPRSMRRLARTSWSAWRTWLWIGMQLAGTIVFLGVLWWILRNPAGH